MNITARKHKKGFTLVELIVVIAIIGVLAAIVVPTTLHFVEQGRVEAANSELANVRDAVNSGLTLNPTLSAENINNILATASITATEYGVVITEAGGVLTFHSNYDGDGVEDLTINTGLTLEGEAINITI